MHMKIYPEQPILILAAREIIPHRLLPIGPNGNKGSVWAFF